MSPQRSIAARVTARSETSDWAFCLLIAILVVVYLASWPHNLQDADESYFLLEAKRVCDGEVLYRDIFWFATPLAHWLMAAAFAVFGTTIGVARLAMAILHGTTAALLGATSRQLGVPRSLALTPAAAYVALAQPTYPYATPHWFATAAMAMILFAAVRTAASRPARRSFLLGLLVGVLAAIYLQKGVAFFALLALLLGWEGLTDRAGGPASRLRPIVERLAYLCGGAATVLVPVLAALLATAGFDAIFDQLVVFPFTGYRTFNRSSWAGVNFLTSSYLRYTSLAVLKYLPLLIPIAAARIVWAWRKGKDAIALRRLCSVVLICVAALLSISYLPDFIHVAFVIAPVFVLAAEIGAAGLATVSRDTGFPRGSAALAAVVLIALGIKMRNNLDLARQQYPFQLDTAFGRINVASEKVGDLITRTRQLVEGSESADLLAYPVFTSLYLTVPATNPTRFQLLSPKWNSDPQIEEVLEVLRERYVPSVVMCNFPVLKGDPIRAFVHDHYDVFFAPGPEDLPCSLYRRK